MVLFSRPFLAALNSSVGSIVCVAAIIVCKLASSIQIATAGGGAAVVRGGTTIARIVVRAQGSLIAGIGARAHVSLTAGIDALIVLSL